MIVFVQHNLADKPHLFLLNNHQIDTCAWEVKEDGLYPDVNKQVTEGDITIQTTLRGDNDAPSLPVTRFKGKTS